MPAGRSSRTEPRTRIRGRIVVLALAGGVLAGCQWARHEPSAPPLIDREMRISADVETVWNAVIDLFEERDWPIGHMDRASGVIATDWMTSGWLTPAPHVGYLDCGGNTLLGKPDRPWKESGRFNVMVRDTDDGVVLKINSVWRAYRDNQLVDCISTGLAENELYAEIRTRAGRR